MNKNNWRYNLISIKELKDATRIYQQQDEFYYKCRNEKINHHKKDGRYPFRRILGATEFFSTIFSIGNLISHIYGYNRYIGSFENIPILSSLLRINLFFTCTCWISSALFHVIDITITRDLDYFAGFVSIVFSLHFIIIRILYNMISLSLLQLISVSLFSIFSILISSHIFYLKNIEFDYSFHKKCCIYILLTTFSLYLLLFLESSSQDYAYNILIYLSLFSLSGLIELYDIPPIYYLLDSHAMFHMVTMVGAPFFYRFIGGDVGNLKIISDY